MNKKGKNNPMFGKTHSVLAKESVAKARKNTRWMYEPVIKTQKAIKIEEVENYLEKGWKLGRPKKKQEPDFLNTY